MKKLKKILKRTTALECMEEIIKCFTREASEDLLNYCRLTSSRIGGFDIQYHGPGNTVVTEFIFRHVHISQHNYHKELLLEFSYYTESGTGRTKIVPVVPYDYTFVAQLIVNFLEKGEYPSE